VSALAAGSIAPTLLVGSGATGWGRSRDGQNAKNTDALRVVPRAPFYGSIQ
jgi:hypothetical protein